MSRYDTYMQDVADALASMNVRAIRHAFRLNGLTLPKDDAKLLRQCHALRAMWDVMSDRLRQESIEWLRRHHCNPVLPLSREDWGQ